MLQLLLFYLASVFISAIIAMLIDKAIYRIWKVKVKAPVFITIAVLLTLWWLFSLIVDG